MRRSAPVYRHLESRQTLLGLEVPVEFFSFFGVVYLVLPLLPAGKAALVLIAVYAAFRLARRGRPPLYLVHYLQWQMRRALGGGWLSAAARARQPRFPHAQLAWRDAASLGPAFVFREPLRHRPGADVSTAGDTERVARAASRLHWVRHLVARCFSLLLRVRR